MPICFRAYIFNVIGQGFILSTLLAHAAYAQTHSRFLELLPRQEVNVSKIGLNAFGNEPIFGSPEEQYEEIRNELGIRQLRLLFAWTDDVQPSPNSPLNHSFHDALIDSLPAGTEALIVLANMPDWMSDPVNWVHGNPRTTFFRKWVRPIVRRYKRKRKIVAFQIFNEPDSTSFFESSVLGSVDSPENYMELLRRSSRFIKRVSNKKVVAAATTSILQNFPETLNYNKRLHELGLEQYSDVTGIHLYGESVERYYFGIGDFLKSLQNPIWVTESGQRGADEQLNYVERVWPFFEKEIPLIERFYYYQFAENSPSNSSFGLRNTSDNQPLSDFYLHLAALN
jgi:hypothetical protein